LPFFHSELAWQLAATCLFEARINLHHLVTISVWREAPCLLVAPASTPQTTHHQVSPWEIESDRDEERRRAEERRKAAEAAAKREEKRARKEALAAQMAAEAADWEGPTGGRSRRRSSAKNINYTSMLQADSDDDYEPGASTSEEEDEDIGLEHVGRGGGGGGGRGRGFARQDAPYMPQTRTMVVNHRPGMAPGAMPRPAYAAGAAAGAGGGRFTLDVIRQAQALHMRIRSDLLGNMPIDPATLGQPIVAVRKGVQGGDAWGRDMGEDWLSVS
jgi:hypothetical protein